MQRESGRSALQRLVSCGGIRLLSEYKRVEGLGESGRRKEARVELGRTSNTHLRILAYKGRYSYSLLHNVGGKTGSGKAVKWESEKSLFDSCCSETWL